MPRVKWLKEEAETFPMVGVRLEPGEQDVTDEQYAHVRGSAWVEDAPARGSTQAQPEPEPAPEPADDTAADTPPAQTPDAPDAPAEEEQ
jgi:hypothetical protein